MTEYQKFLQGYMSAILFAERDLNGDPESDDSLYNEGFSEDCFAEETRAMLRADALQWYWDNRNTLRAAYAAQPGDFDPARAGADYYFTLAGHGTGFWDRGLGDLGAQLSDACRPGREFCCYVTDDGRVCID